MVGFYIRVKIYFYDLTTVIVSKLKPDQNRLCYFDQVRFNKILTRRSSYPLEPGSDSNL